MSNPIVENNKPINVELTKDQEYYFEGTHTLLLLNYKAYVPVIPSYFVYEKPSQLSRLCC